MDEKCGLSLQFANWGDCSDKKQFREPKFCRERLLSQEAILKHGKKKGNINLLDKSFAM